MKFILAHMFKNEYGDLKIDCYYGGVHEKYYDSIKLTASSSGAKVFEDTTEATAKMEILNKIYSDMDFHLISV